MSYVIGSIHSPSAINCCTRAHFDADYVIFGRGNELLFNKISKSGIDSPIIYPIFGTITEIDSVVIGSETYLVVLLQSEKIIFFSYKESQLICVKTQEFSVNMGERILPNDILSTSSSLIIVHTRKRTLHIFILDRESAVLESFTALVPFFNIKSIICNSNDSSFIIIGQSLEKKLQISRFTVENSTINLENSQIVEDYYISPCVTQLENDRLILGAGHKIYKYKNFSKEEEIETKCSDIVSIIPIKNEEDLILCDSNGKFYSMVDSNFILSTSATSRVYDLGYNFYFQSTECADSHILYYNGQVLKIYDTYAQINSINSMTRKGYITKEGKFRMLVNGSATAVEVNVDCKYGKKLFLLPNHNQIILTTFTKTFILSNSFDLIHSFDQPTIHCSEHNENTCFVTKYEIKIGDTIVEKFEKGILSAHSLENHLIVATEENIIYYYDSVNNETEPTKHHYDEQISVVTMNSTHCAISFSNSLKVIKIKLDDWSSEDITVDPALVSVSSLMFWENDLYIAGCGIIQVNSSTVFNVSNDSIFLKNVHNRLLAVSDAPAFIDKESIDFIASSPSLDAVPYEEEKILFLTEKGLSLISIDSDYHSHLSDIKLKDYQIALMATDEFDKCPIVFACKKTSGYVLVGKQIKYMEWSPLEEPKCMLWINYMEKYLLIVGCKFENKGRLHVFDVELSHLSSIDLSFPVDALTYVEKTWIAAAFSKNINIYSFDKEFKIVFQSSIETRFGCGSITSPNSCYIIYADRHASIILYSVVEGQIVEVARDFNQKKLKYAAAVSSTEFIAFDQNGIAYYFFYDKNFRTIGAYNIGAEVTAMLSAPPITFITKSGSIQVIMKCEESLIKIYNTMRSMCRGIGGLSNDSWRVVKLRNQEYPTGRFVDGDFLLTFCDLPQESQEVIARNTNIEVDQMNEMIHNYYSKLIEYREKVQEPTDF